MAADGFGGAAVDPRLLKRMPSLRAQVPGLIDGLYADAREEALEGFAAYGSERIAQYKRLLPTKHPHKFIAQIEG